MVPACLPLGFPGDEKSSSSEACTAGSGVRREERPVRQGSVATRSAPPFAKSQCPPPARSRSVISDDRGQDHQRALDAFHRAVHAAYQTWVDTRDEPWPGWGNMSPRQLAELGIPELPARPEPEPPPPRRIPSIPASWCTGCCTRVCTQQCRTHPGRLATRQQCKSRWTPRRRPCAMPGTPCAAAGNRCAIPVNLRSISPLNRAGQPMSPSTTRAGGRGACASGVHEIHRAPSGASRADTRSVPRPPGG